MTAIAVMYGGMPDAIVAQVKHMPPLVELHGEADRNVPLASGGELVNLAIGELGVPVLFTEAARFQSWLDVEAAQAELTIITAEMPDSSIHGMRIGLHFRRSLISAPGYTGSRGTCEVRPRGKLCCHRPQSAVSGHFRTLDRADRFGPAAAMADRRSPFCDDLGRDIRKSDLYKAVATGS